MSKAFAYLNDQSGASAPEFALLIAIVGVAIGAAAKFVGGTAPDAINAVATCIRTHTNAATC